MAISGTGTGPFTITGTETTLAIYNYVVGQNAANATKNSDNTQFDFNCVLNVGNGTTTTVWNSQEENVRIDASSFTIALNASLFIGLSNPARAGGYWRWNMANDAFVINGTLGAYASRLYASGRVASNTGALCYFEECVIAFLDSITNFDGPQNPTITYVRCFIAGATAVAVKLGGTVSLTGTKISGATYAFQTLPRLNSPATYTVNDYVGQGNTNDAVPNVANSGQLNIIGAFDGAGTPRTSLITAMHATGNTVRLQWRYNLTSLFNNAGQSGTNVRIRNLNSTVVYTGQTNGSGVIPQQILTRLEYINSSTGTARFPYQVLLRKYDRTSQSLVYNADNHTTQQAVHIAVPYLTLTEAQALALTGITFTPSGATGGTVTISGARTIAELWQAYRAWISQTANFDSEDTWTFDGTNLNIGAWTISGIEFLSTGSITTTTATASGAFSIEVIGTVNQATPTNLPATAKATTLVYNTNTDISVTYATGATIGTVRNDGTGIVTIAGGSITDYTDAQINYLDSNITAVGIDSATIYQTEANRDSGANPGATFTTSLNFKYGSVVNGVTMQNTVYLRVVVGSVTLFAQITLTLGSNTLDLGVQGQLSAIGAKVDLTAKEATLLQTETDIIAEINANETKIDTAIIKIDTVTTKVDTTKTSVDAILIDTNELQTNQGNWNTAVGFATPSDIISARDTITSTIPSNPLLTTDSRLDNLDVKISTRLATTGYTPPDNTTISQIKTKVDTLQNTDLTGIATTTNVTSARDSIITEVNANETKIDAIKTKTDTLINTDLSLVAKTTELTSAKDAIITEVNQIPTNPLLASNYTAPDNTTIGLIKTKVDTLQNTDITTLAKEATLLQTETDIIAEINANETKIDTAITKIDTKSSQASVNAIPTNPLLTNDTRLNNLDAAISTRSTLTAPQVRTELSTELARLDVAVSTRLAGSSYTAPNNSDIASIKSKTDQLIFTGTNLNSVAKVVEDKTGYSLTTAERSAIAAAVEQSILNEGDGAAILNAIVGAIGNQNIDQIALVAAIRADIERSGGTSALIKSKVDTLQNTDLTGIATATNISSAQSAIVTEINANETKIDTAITKIDTVTTKVDTKPTLSQIEGSTTLPKIVDMQKVNRNVIKASKLIPAGETF